MWTDLFIAPFRFFIEWPLAALAPAALFAFLFLRRRGSLVAAAAILWALYSVYELTLKLRILCSGECNIRVDLLLLVPVLWAASFAGVLQFFLKKGKRSGAL